MYADESGIVIPDYRALYPKDRNTTTFPCLPIKTELWFSLNLFIMLTELPNLVVFVIHIV